ncbi:putative ATP-dependent helicase DinG [Arsenophonus endosymbiont of Bemisia tabaci Q2]|nr:putative ATP-dependent helicase DinG [Arsenophonus endosymbiont of Bemisia tabaci Q2]
MQDCQLDGGNAFYDVQLPDAVLNLKQGVGRLLRDVNDSGVIIIFDKRLVSRPYGEIF